MPADSIMERAQCEHDELRTLLNPPELCKASARVFSGDEKAREILEDFTIHKFTYHTLEAEGMTPAMKAAATEKGFETCTELNVHIAISTKNLKEAPPGTTYTPWIRFHGGGGMTGCPFTPNWLLQADYIFITQSEKPIISIEPEYPKMPESSGAEILAAAAQCLLWLSSQLEKNLYSIGIQVKIDWTAIVLFAESFGAYMAHKAWLLLVQKEIPSMLWPRAVVLRCPLSGIYARDPPPEAEYCGVHIPVEKARKDCVQILEHCNSMMFTKKRCGSQPPDAMYLAFAASVSHQWGDMWQEQSVIQMIESAPNDSDVETFFYIMHGTADQHVPHESSQKLRALLESKFPKVKVDLILQPGKAHAWDYNEPLGEKYTRMLEQHCI